MKDIELTEELRGKIDQYLDEYCLWLDQNAKTIPKSGKDYLFINEENGTFMYIPVKEIERMKYIPVNKDII